MTHPVYLSGEHVSPILGGWGVTSEIKAWASENLRGYWYFQDSMTVMPGQSRFHIEFKDENDAILFKLRWIG